MRVLMSPHTAAVVVKFFCLGGGGKIESGIILAFAVTATATAAVCGNLY